MASEQIPSPLVDLLRQYKLLQEEFEFEKETFYQQTQRAGIPKRIQQGVCWYPVSANKSYYNSLNQLIIEIKRDENDDTDHNFEYGRPVCFSVLTKRGICVISVSRQPSVTFTKTRCSSCCPTPTVFWIFKGPWIWACNSILTEHPIKPCFPP